MKLVAHISDFGWPVPADELPRLLADYGEQAEASGFDGIAVADHMWQHPIMGGPYGASLEAYTTLAFLAAHTRTARLMTTVTGVHFRHPAVLAKTVTTLDVLSGGRAWLGIGTGHYEEECTGLGISFPPARERYEQLEDALELCLRMWRGEHGDDGPYAGHHVHAQQLINAPQARQRPHPPILVAGEGERRTLPLVARYADACNLRPTPEIPRKLDVLRRLCDDAGTDFDHIERTCAFAFDANDIQANGPGQLLDQLRWLAGMGIETVIGRVDGDDPRRGLELLGRHVIAPAAELDAA